MSRATNSAASKNRKKKILKLAKGNRGRRATNFTIAKETVERALVNAYKGRRERKRDFRALWITRISAAVREHGISYSVFMNGVKKNNIQINRKLLADMAVRDPEAFKAIIDKAMTEV